MSRLSNYFECAKLARMHLVTAIEKNAKNDTQAAIRHLSEAMIDLLTAMNNVSSIAFNSKPKRRSK